MDTSGNGSVGRLGYCARTSRRRHIRALWGVICICIFIYLFVFMYVCMHVCVYTYMYVYIHMFIYRVSNRPFWLHEAQLFDSKGSKLLNSSGPSYKTALMSTRSAQVDYAFLPEELSSATAAATHMHTHAHTRAHTPKPAPTPTPAPTSTLTPVVQSSLHVDVLTYFASILPVKKL